MSAEQRFQYSEFAVEQFLKLLSDRKIDYGLSGRELLNCSSDFQNLLNRLQDDTSTFMRYFPDVITATERGSSLVEVKRGKSIERNAYNAYRLLQDTMRCIVYVAVLRQNHFYISTVDKLSFKPQTRRNWPILDGCWNAPREFDESWTREQYLSWKSRNPQASGTTFAYIDFDGTEWGRILEVPQ